MDSAVGLGAFAGVVTAGVVVLVLLPKSARKSAAGSLSAVVVAVVLVPAAGAVVTAAASRFAGLGASRRWGMLLWMVFLSVGWPLTIANPFLSVLTDRCV